MSYLRTKGLPLRRSKKGTMVRGQAEKSEDERFVTLEQFKKILKTIQHDTENVNQERDYCAIACGFYLGLRVGEAAMLRRENFRLLDKGIVYVRRLKQSPRIPVICGATVSGRTCGRKFRVSAKNLGKSHRCPACGHKTKIVAENPGVEVDLNPPERPLPFLETDVRKFLRHYLDKVMPKRQEFLFVNRHFPDKPLSPCTLGLIFGSYAQKAGLSPAYSWHSLRHGRGVQLYDNPEIGKDVKVIQAALGQKSLSAASFYAHLSPQKRADVQRALDGKRGFKL